MFDGSVLREVKLLFRAIESGGLEESVTAVFFFWLNKNLKKPLTLSQKCLHV